MHFDLIKFIFNSLVLLFFTITLGNLFGDIKFRKFNFGITGTLFIGLFIGYFLTKYAVTIPEGSKHISKAQNILKGNIIDNSISAEIGRASCRKECRSRWSPYH